MGLVVAAARRVRMEPVALVEHQVALAPVVRREVLVQVERTVRRVRRARREAVALLVPVERMVVVVRRVRRARREAVALLVPVERMVVVVHQVRLAPMEAVVPLARMEPVELMGQVEPRALAFLLPTAT